VSRPAAGQGLCLAIDTSTRTSIVAVGRVEVAGGPADVLAISRRVVAHRHGSHLLEQIDETLEAAGVSLDDVTAVVVGSGPGSFTGLRVGLATAKTVAHVRGLPLVGVRSSDALRHVAVATAGVPPVVAVVLPAGAHDHYLVRAAEDPVLVPPGGLQDALAGAAVLAVDMDAALLGPAAAALGEAAVAGLPAALLAMAAERLAAADRDDPAELVPAYVALPRGVRRGAEELGWSPDLR
jgi:tRNA threonylcarbamoyl adenosine modification protein YeaZ